MTAELSFSIVSLFVYGFPLLELLYIGKKRPSWRLELFGVLFVAMMRAGLYAFTAAFYAGWIDVQFSSLVWLSRTTSLIMGLVFNVYLLLTIARIHNE